MIILNQHFEGKDTYIVGDIVSNGCQMFHINLLDEVCNEFKVPNKIKEEVIVAHRANKDTKEDYISLAKHGNYSIRLAALKAGADPMLFVNDPHWIVRRAALKLIADPTLFINDPYWEVRIAAIESGIDPMLFINDPYWRVRLAALKSGVDPNLFVNDSNDDVRSEASERLISANKN